MRYGIENLLFDVKKLLVAKLNAQITAVEAEKIAQGLPVTNLLVVDAVNGYFEQNWSDKILNIRPAIFYGVENVAAEGIGPSTKETYKIFVEVVYTDDFADNLTTHRIHRYAEALKNVIEQNFDQIRMVSRIKVETVRPIAFKLDMNTSEEIKVGGISLITALA